MISLFQISKSAKEKIFKVISMILWPFLLGISLWATMIACHKGMMIIGFNIIYFTLAMILLGLEYLMPHERSWAKSDGQLFTDILHTLVSKGTVQTLVVFSAALGLAKYITPMAEHGYGIWPREWPLFPQVILGIVVAEFGLYWAHRLAHEWPRLWHFHAIHHSVEKLWVVNTGRFHFIDSIKSIIPGTLILVISGAPMEVVTWLSAITAYVGLLTHCNIEMRFGFLSKLFNTPALHRWHHSRDLREGNKNYGENIMLWDWVFGTWFDEARRPPADIGINEIMPQRFVEQLIWPFKRAFGNR